MNRFIKSGLVGAALVATTMSLTPSQAQATVINPAPLSFPEVKGLNGHDGEVLVTTVGTVIGTKSIVIGGNFDYIVTPDGKQHAAINLAAISASNPNKIVYAGHASSFVRSLYLGGGALYVGGDFTSVGGKTRNHLAKFNASTMGLLNWNPKPSASVRALAGNGSQVVVASADISEYTIATDKKVWTRYITGGPARTLMFHPNGRSVYVGGQFETYGGRTQHGLVRVVAANGLPTKFNAYLLPDKRSTYDGDCVLSLSWDAGHARLIVGTGGNTRNSLWSLNADTGSWHGSNWGASRIPTEGDVQAVAIVGNRVVIGFHRNHPNKVAPVSNRFLNVYATSNGSFVKTDPGLWGTQTNEAGSNNGVSSLVYSSSLHRLLIGGSFRGYGDPFYNNGTPRDTGGAPGKYHMGLLALKIS